jgi:predicted ATP-grasp superfamily ATP-dependent carboligase
VRDLGLRLFQHVGLLGLGNVEFKRDPRDGMLKLIESNARFTMANGLVAAAGYDLGSFVYHRVAGLQPPVLDGLPYKQGLRMWRPGRDFLAFLDLRSRGELTLPGWLASVAHPQVFEYFSLADPGPWGASAMLLPGRVRRYLGRTRSRTAQTGSQEA